MFLVFIWKFAHVTVQITFIFIDFRVCDFAFAFKTQNAPCVSRFKRFLFSDRFQFAFYTQTRRAFDLSPRLMHLTSHITHSNGYVPYIAYYRSNGVDQLFRKLKPKPKLNPPNAHRSQIKICENRQMQNVQFPFMPNAFPILKPIQKSSKRVCTVAQTRHFIKHLLHDFTKHLLHDFTISSTILQFPPRYYNFLHDFTISSTILQFPPRFYNFLHDFTKHLLHDFTKHLLHDFTISSTILQNICSTILQFSPRFYNFLHDFTIFSTILQNRRANYKIVEEIVKSWRKL